MEVDREFAMRQAIDAAMSLRGDQKWGALFALRTVAFHLESDSYAEVSKALDELSAEKQKG